MDFEKVSHIDQLVLRLKDAIARSGNSIEAKESLIQTLIESGWSSFLPATGARDVTARIWTHPDCTEKLVLKFQNLEGKRNLGFEWIEIVQMCANCNGSNFTSLIQKEWLKIGKFRIDF